METATNSLEKVVISSKPSRPGAGKRTLSLKQLRESNASTPPPPVPEDPRIKNIGIIHAVSHPTCVSASHDSGRLVCTLFYQPKGKDPAALANHDSYGHYITESALMDLNRIFDELLNPWYEWQPFHRCLDKLKQPRVLEVIVPKPQYVTLAEIRKHESIAEFEQRWGIDVVIQHDDAWRLNKRLVVFDMDSTLIQQEVIDELARFAGLEKEVSAITVRAMNGELDFSESLRERCKALAGLPATVFEELKPKITLTPGATELCAALKVLGFKLAVLSGGFMPLANWLKNTLRLDYAIANTLIVGEDGKLTGEVSGDVVNAEYKEASLIRIAKEEGILLDQSIAIGDGANDLKMMEAAGIGIAFNAKAKVQEEAPSRLNSPSLTDVLFLLGLSSIEQQQILSGSGAPA